MIIMLNSCKTQEHKYIHGYIFNKNNNPIMGLKIQDQYDKKIISHTNAKGYFKITKMIKGRILYVYNNELKIDSIYVVTNHPERGASYNFVDGRSDTLFIDMKY